MSDEALRKIVYDGGCLLEVEERRFESATGFVTTIRLVFEKLRAHVIAMPDDDTVAIRFDPLPDDHDSVAVPSTQREPWIRVRGCDCTWAWLLTNQQGYTDGLRLEFRTDSGSHVVEMIVAASQFTYHDFVAA